MDNTAVDRIANLGVEAQKANRLDTNVPAVILTDENGRQRIESIEHLEAQRSRFRGTFSTTSLDDFAQYVIAHTGGNGFIDIKHMTACVFFDLMIDGATHAPVSPGQIGVPGHADHRALLSLEPTAAFGGLHYAAYNPRNLGPTQFAQKSLVEWLEDWRDYLAADYPDTTADYANDPSQMRTAINALRKVKIKASAEAVHTDKDFGASKSALEDVEASSDIGLPRGFRFACVPYDALDQNTFYLRLGVRPDDEKPTFVLRWQMRERDLENLGQQFKVKLLNAIGDKATMLLGSFDPGK